MKHVVMIVGTFAVALAVLSCSESKLDAEEINGIYTADDVDATIGLELMEDGKVKMQGDATWMTGMKVHTGEIAGMLELDGKTMEYDTGSDEYDCHVKFEFSNGLLVVEDNYRCGGMNVTFTSVYKKTAPKVTSWEIYELVTP